MSKGLRGMLCSIGILVLAALSTGSVRSQPRVTIEIKNDLLPRVSVTGERVTSKLPRNPRNLSFRNPAGESNDLSTRISNLRAYGAEHNELALKKLVEGEYISADDIYSWQYSIDLTPRSSRTAAAHGSWIANDHGLLMLDDLLPIGMAAETEVVLLELKVPEDWKVFSPGGAEMWKYLILTANYSEDVMPIGKGWRTRSRSKAGFALDTYVHDTWHFSDDEAAEMSDEIFRRYEKVFGPTGGTRAGIVISGFPNSQKPGEWEAETRKNIVTIISSDMPFRTQSLQRLHEQLRHELFHLWIPNKVNLTGNYDWFYEGFALYESLKVAVGLNRIRFEDFLDTLSRAYTIDSAQSQRTSLIHASNTRFSGSNTQVYSRGMLVAFLCDLALLEQSKGKRSVENLLTEIFAKHSDTAQPVDGNTAVLEILRTNPKMISIADNYITGSNKIEWADELATVGIADGDPGPLTMLRVKDKLNGRQKALLDKLGYNNWRRLSVTSK